jgi:type I restriction enzyme S subunit
MVLSETIKFPVHWRVARISDFAKVKGGKRLPLGTALTSEPTDHPYIRVSDFKDGFVEKSGLQFVPDEVFPKIARYTISSSDIYISIVGTIGLIGRVGAELEGANLTENAAKICEIEPWVDTDYLKYFLRSQRGQEQIRALTVGSTQPKLALFRIGDIQIPIPPKGEQLWISQVLRNLDNKIRLIRQMNETLEGIAMAIFKSWFIDFDPVRAKSEGRQPAGMSKEIADLFPNNLSDCDVGQKPEGWCKCTLEDFAELNPESWSKSTAPEKIAYVDLSNTKWGVIESTTNYFWQDAPSRAQRVLRLGDSIVGTVRPGNGSYAIISEAGLTGSTGFAVLRPKTQEFTEFVYLAATAPENIERLAHLADGGAYPAVRPEVVAATSVTIPANRVIIEEFSKITRTLLNKIAENGRESRTLAGLRDALLPKLLSGEIKIKETEKQLEQVL